MSENEWKWLKHAARELVPRTAIEDSRARAYGSEKPEARAIERAIYGYHPGPFNWRTRRAVPHQYQISIERFLAIRVITGQFRLRHEHQQPAAAQRAGKGSFFGKTPAGRSAYSCGHVGWRRVRAYGRALGRLHFFEGNCGEISKLRGLITTGLTRSPEKQNGKKPAKATTPPIWHWQHWTPLSAPKRVISTCTHPDNWMGRPGVRGHLIRFVLFLRNLQCDLSKKK